MIEQKETSLPETAAPSNIVIFGAAGDLTKRKLMPALVRMTCCGLVHPQSRIIGVANRTEQVWFDLIRDALREFSPEVGDDDAAWQKFAVMLKLVPGDLCDEDSLHRLAEAWKNTTAEPTRCSIARFRRNGTAPSRVQCRKPDSPTRQQGYRRLVIEKPFGMDLEIGACAEQGTPVGGRRVADLPYRSLPWQGERAEPAGVPFRQRHYGAAVEPQLHRQYPDFGVGDPGHRISREILRTVRRAARHDPEPSDAGDDAGGDGAAGRIHRGRGARRENESAARGASLRARRRACAYCCGAVRIGRDRG